MFQKPKKEFTKVQGMSIDQMKGIPGVIGLEVWIEIPKEGETPPSQYRFAFPYDAAIEFGAHLANLAEKLRGEEFST